MHVSHILYFLIILLSLNAWSQNLGEVIVYNTNNSSLVYNQINCIEFDDNNRLWIGTQNGLNTFDTFGNWDLFNVENTSGGLSSNIIKAMEQTNNTSPPAMFIGTINGIHSISEETVWSNYGETCSPNNGTINALLYNNTLWSGSTDGLCIETSDGNWEIQNTSTGWYSNNITSIKKNLNNDMIAIGTMNGGLITYNSEFNIYYSSNSNILDNTVLDVIFDQNNNIIICTPQSGLGVLTENQSWIWFNTLNSNLPSNSLRKVILDNDNSLWIATLENGISHYKNNIFYNYNTSNSNLPDNKINCMEFDASGNLWLGTNNSGLVKIISPKTNINTNGGNIVNVYPTIFSSYITIESRQKLDATILDQTGREIQKITLLNNSKKINTSTYPSGVYLLNIISHNENKSYMIIKN